MKKFRTRFQIACEILNKIDIKPMIIKGNLVLETNISNNGLTNFLNEFIKRKFVEEVKLNFRERGQGQAKFGYKITELGRVTCDKLYNVNNEFIWINEINTYKQ